MSDQSDLSALHSETTLDPELSAKKLVASKSGARGFLPIWGISQAIQNWVITMLDGLRLTLEPNVHGVYTADTTVLVRKAVKLSGTGTCALAEAADAPSASPFLGIVVQKLSAVRALVRYQGEVGGFTGLTAGHVVCIGATAGTLVTQAFDADRTGKQVIGFVKNATVIVLVPNHAAL